MIVGHPAREGPPVHWARGQTEEGPAEGLPGGRFEETDQEPGGPERPVPETGA